MVSEVYRTFIIVIGLEALEEKYKLNLDRQNYIILSNRKSMGKLTPQFVRHKPSIKEVKSSTSLLSNSNACKTKPLVEEISEKDSELEYTITQVSQELAIAEFKLYNLVRFYPHTVAVACFPLRFWYF